MIFIALLSAAALAVCALYVRDLSRARVRLRGRSQTIPTSLGDVELASLGQGEPILVIHGAAGGFDQGLDMTGALAARGYRLIAPSRFGYLRSVLPDAATNAMQADIYAELLDRLGVDKVAVIAISAGAWSSLQFAIRHPDRCRALVLLVPADYLPEGTSVRGGAAVWAIFNSDFIAWLAVRLAPIMPGAMIRMMLGSDASVVGAAEPSEQARARQVLDHLLPMGSRTRGIAFDIRSAAIREPYAIEAISCPVLAISAADDPFGTAPRAKFIASGVPDGRPVIYPTGGHALIGRYEAALREVAAFLEERRAEPPKAAAQP